MKIKWQSTLSGTLLSILVTGRYIVCPKQGQGKSRAYCVAITNPFSFGRAVIEESVLFDGKEMCIPRSLKISL